MAARAISFALEDGLAACRIAVAGHRSPAGGDGVQVGQDDFGLKILQIMRRHGSAGDAILNDFDQRVFRVGLAEPPVAEIDAGHLIALRPVAENAIRAEQPPAFLDVSGSISVLRKQGYGQRQQERKWDAVSCVLPHVGNRVLW